MVLKRFSTEILDEIYDLVGFMNVLVHLLDCPVQPSTSTVNYGSTGMHVAVWLLVAAALLTLHERLSSVRSFSSSIRI